MVQLGLITKADGIQLTAPGAIFCVCHTILTNAADKLGLSLTHLVHFSRATPLPININNLFVLCVSFGHSGGAR